MLLTKEFKNKKSVYFRITNTCDRDSRNNNNFEGKKHTSAASRVIVLWTMEDITYCAQNSINITLQLYVIF